MHTVETLPSSTGDGWWIAVSYPVAATQSFMFEMKMGIDLLRTFTEERTTNRHVVYFMTFLVMIEKTAEGRREGLSQAYSLRTYSIVVVKD